MLEQIQKELDRLKSKGATYADARWYPSEDNEQMIMVNGNLKSNTSSKESGIGVRVLYGGAWGFRSSSEMPESGGCFCSMRWTMPALHHKG